MTRQGSLAPLDADAFAALSTTLLAHARRMTEGQILDLADSLHDLIRSRHAAERSFARRHGPQPGLAPAQDH